MNTTQEQFFALLRSGLWKKPVDAELFPVEGTDWETIFRMAKEQTLIAIIWDGLETLPKAARPPRDIYRTWALLVSRIEYANKKSDERLVSILALYHEAGLHPVVLIGQSISRNYRHSDHCQCSDIDIYVGKEDYDTANRLLLEQGATPKGEESPQHTSFDWDGLHIKNHRIIAKLNNPSANKCFQKLADKWYPHKIYTAYLKGNPFPAPPAWFHALFIFIHAFIHFLNSGVKLRHICDWVCLLNLERSHINIYTVIPQLQEMELLKAAEAFGYIAVNYLGLPKLHLPLSPTNGKELGEKLLAEILSTGNFGMDDKRIQSLPKGYWAGKWYTFRRATKRCRELRAFAPQETLWYPWTLIKETLTIQRNKRKPHTPGR